MATVHAILLIIQADTTEYKGTAIWMGIKVWRQPQRQLWVLKVYEKQKEKEEEGEGEREKKKIKLNSVRSNSR